MFVPVLYYQGKLFLLSMVQVNNSEMMANVCTGTVEEGNFVLEYNFVQKKVFLCELLLPYLSSWGVKTIF